MITKVVLKNIKSHLDTTIHLDPGFNVIAGETDEGKSTVFWALNWVLFNKPFGWNPKPWKHLKAGRESRAEIHFIDGTIVARVRTASKNFYEFNGEELSPQGGVPDKIEKFVNMNESNVQIQKEAFFLLDATPGQAAKEISKVANLEGMDEAMKEAASRVKKAKTEVKILDKALIEKDKEIDELSWTTSASEDLSKINAKEKSIVDLGLKVAVTKEILVKCAENREGMVGLASDDCVDDAIDINNRIKKATELRLAVVSIETKLHTVTSVRVELDPMPDYTGAKTSLQNMSVSFASCDELKSKLDSVNTKVGRVSQLRKSLQDEMPTTCITDLADIKERISKTLELTERLKRVNNTLSSIKLLKGDIKQTTSQLACFEVRKKDLINTLEVCPLCSSILT